MLRKWYLKGFKSVYKRTDFELAPLTIFSGANSSGKSTVIQSILMTAQTLQNHLKNKQIILNGSIVKLGNYNDVKSYGTNDEINIGFELYRGFENKKGAFIPILDNKSVIECNFNFNSMDESELSTLHPIITRSEISIFSEDSKKEDAFKINVKKYKESLNERKNRLNLFENRNIDESILSYEVDVFNIRDEFILGNGENFQNKQKYVGVQLNHFMPKSLYTIRNYYNQKTNLIFNIIENFNFIKGKIYPFSKQVFSDDSEVIGRICRIILETIFEKIDLNEFEEIKNNKRREKVISSYNSLKEIDFNKFTLEQLEEFLVSLSNFLINAEINNKNILKYKELSEKKVRSSFEEKNVLFKDRTINNLLDNITDSIENYFSDRIKYLGPLRDEPKAIYPGIGTDDYKNVGYKGEFTAAILDLHKNEIIEYISPSSVNDENYIIKKNTLLSAVTEWIEYMGISHEIRTVDRGKLGHELQVQQYKNGKFSDLTNVGVGVSQVLPILVSTLLAERNSTIIFEQPELHLHPKVQTRLGDFFLTMIHLNKQCIIETHSEYLINRLRYKAISSKKDKIPENTIIYFVEQEENESSYNKIQINENGIIPEWPRGFFDESEKIAIDILSASRSNKGEEDIATYFD